MVKNNNSTIKSNKNGCEKNTREMKNKISSSKKDNTCKNSFKKP